MKLSFNYWNNTSKVKINTNQGQLMLKVLKVVGKEVVTVTTIAVVMGVLITGGLYWAAKNSGWV